MKPLTISQILTEDLVSVANYSGPFYHIGYGRIREISMFHNYAFSYDKGWQAGHVISYIGGSYTDHFRIDANGIIEGVYTNRRAACVALITCKQKEIEELRKEINGNE